MACQPRIAMTDILNMRLRTHDMVKPRPVCRLWLNVFAAAALLAGCADGSRATDTATVTSSEERANMTTPSAIADFPIPANARDVEQHEESGQDTLVLVAFSAPAADAEIFAANAIPEGVKLGVNPGLAYLGKGKDWWLENLPDGAAGGEFNDSATGQVTKLVLGPEKGGERRVWVARFGL